MKKLLFLAVMSLGLSTSIFGLATVWTSVQGGDTLTFSSNQQGVKVYRDDDQVGIIQNGPYDYKLKRDGKEKTFKFRKDGYKTVTVTLSPTFDMLFWGNLFLGASIGSSVDSLSTKNAYTYSPKQVFVNMERK